MKKLIYIIAFVFVASLALTSCTEENVKPTVRGDESPSTLTGSGSSDKI